MQVPGVPEAILFCPPVLLHLLGVNNGVLRRQTDHAAAAEPGLRHEMAPRYDQGVGRRHQFGRPGPR
jgi:hypothetical protein